MPEDFLFCQGTDYYLLTNIKLSASVQPQNASIKNVKWESTNSDIIEVENNEFKINGTGKVLLIAYGHDYVSESFVINIIEQEQMVLYIFIFIFLIVVIVTIIHKKKDSIANIVKRIQVQSH